MDKTEFLNEEQADFFNWCDEMLMQHAPKEGAILNYWHPRKTQNGVYELIFVLTVPSGERVKKSIPIPEIYHELLEQEYFILHQGDHNHEH